MRLFQDINDPELVELLRTGAVGVIPTDTVYGLVCRAADERSVERLYETKGRDGKPGTIIAAKIQQLVDLGIRARYLKAVEHFWPGPISIIIPADLGYLNQGVAGLALRIPDNEPLRELLRQTGPLQTTSANAPGEPTAATVEAARAYFGDTVDFYVDGGDLSGRPSSTVIRIVDDAIEVLRAGAVKIDENGRIAR
ncbi:MAG TPA: L-threonylcarbamoyladenylate synthase [Candidatus Saccharimonadales bacterium]|jgi:tRNA threonylcarbamoyl adenosine modification protein (Sua5/YciO/YrdC/YwlC family)